MKKLYLHLSLVLLLIAAFTTGAVLALHPTVNPWLMDRYDNARSGNTPSTVPSNNRTLWTSTVASSPSTPLVLDGKVITTSGGYVYALDETTGVKLWQSTYYNSLTSGMAYADGRIFFGSSQGYLYCINATTGAYMWEYQATTSGQITTSPVVSAGKVFFGTTDHYLYAINVSNHVHLWHFTAPDAIHSSPAVDGDLLYFGCDDGKLYALNKSKATASLKWSYQTNGRIRCPPTVYQGKVLFGSSSTDKAIFALNKTNGNFIWKYQLDIGYATDNGLAVANGIIYFAPDNYRKIYAIYANATAGNHTEIDPDIRFWSTTVEYYPTAPIYADGKIIIGTRTASNYKIYALDAIDYHAVWWSKLSYSPKDPIVADGRVFLAMNLGLICFGNTFPPVTYHYTVNAGGKDWDVTLVINATASQTLNTTGLESLNKVVYTLEGIPYTTGMSNFTIPNGLLGGPYTVTIDSLAPSEDPIVTPHGEYSSIYFTYTHSSHTIVITGTTYLPEYPTAAMLSTLIMLSLAVVALAKRKTLKK